MDICIYHSRDFDGWSSAAIVKTVWPDVELMGWDYGDDLPEFPDGKRIIMVDISLCREEDKRNGNPMQYMIDLANKSTQLVWIDHHKSAIEDYEKVKDQFPDTFFVKAESGLAACEHTWNTLRPKDKMPLAIKLLGLYDTFRKEEAGETWDTTVMPFQYGLRLVCNGPEEFPVELLNHMNSQAIIPHVEAGKKVLTYIDNFNKTYAKSAQVFPFAGYTCIALNTPQKSSVSFDHAFNPEEHDFMMAYSRSKDMWHVSFYCESDKVDCSIIAKQFNGGGHAGASGCVMDDTTLLDVLNGNK